MKALRINSPPENGIEVWKPLPGAQTKALQCPAQILLLHGTRGGGKTEIQLLHWLLNYVGKGFGNRARGVVISNGYKSLGDIVAKSQRLYDGLGTFTSSIGSYKWTFHGGEILELRSFKSTSEYQQFHGQEYCAVYPNELTLYATNEIYYLIMTCNRTGYIPPTGKPELPLTIVATTNPYGAGHNWVKAEFIDQTNDCEIGIKRFKVFNARTNKEEIFTRTQCHIFLSYKENPYLPMDYVATLQQISDPNRRKAWLEGSWDITSGGLFDDLWDRNIHYIQPFKIPHDWKVYRAYDHGQSAPFSVQWWAIASGSEYHDEKNQLKQSIKGDLYLVAEYYGWNGTANKGLNLTADKIAKNILERESKFPFYVNAGPADNSINNMESTSGNSIAAIMSSATGGKITFLPSDKSPGSRALGHDLIRQLLGNALQPDREDRGLFIFNTCQQFARTVPTIQRDEKNLDDSPANAEDHSLDSCRYMVLFAMAQQRGVRQMVGLY